MKQKRAADQNALVSAATGVIHNQTPQYKKHLRSTHAVSNPEANRVKFHALIGWPQLITVGRLKSCSKTRATARQQLLCICVIWNNKWRKTKKK